jgi:hypothetical protein
MIDIEGVSENAQPPIAAFASLTNCSAACWGVIRSKRSSSHSRVRMSGISPAPFGGGDFDNAWVLGVDFVLAAPGGRDIELGSPATNGRPGGSGYGGFFWRAPAGDVLPHVFAEAADGADVVNASTEPWVALTTLRYGLVFTGLGSGDHWFVRAADYPGVCAALAYKRPLVVAAGSTVFRHHHVVVVDGRLDRAAAGKLAQQAQGHP